MLNRSILFPAPLLLIFALCPFSAKSHAEEAVSTSFTTTTFDNLSQLEALHQEATELVLINDFTGAVKVYSEIILLEPDDETAYTEMGNTYMILGNFERAESCFLNALDINPENEDAQLGLQKIRDPDSPTSTPPVTGSDPFDDSPYR